jgi:hypothetical protein
MKVEPVEEAVDRTEQEGTVVRPGSSGLMMRSVGSHIGYRVSFPFLAARELDRNPEGITYNRSPQSAQHSVFEGYFFHRTFI